MAMDWDRSGDDAGAGAWRGRLFDLKNVRGIPSGLVFGAGRAVSEGERRGAAAAWLAHVDAGRIGEGVR